MQHWAEQLSVQRPNSVGTSGIVGYRRCYFDQKQIRLNALATKSRNTLAKQSIWTKAREDFLYSCNTRWSRRPSFKGGGGGDRRSKQLVDVFETPKWNSWKVNMIWILCLQFMPKSRQNYFVFKSLAKQWVEIPSPWRNSTVNVKMHYLIKRIKIQLPWLLMHSLKLPNKDLELFRFYYYFYLNIYR